MERKKIATIAFFFTLFVYNNPLALAKNIYPAEILGRKLGYFGLGWIGHVAVATSSLSSPDDMNTPADHVIEILNSTPAIQINSIPDFKSRTKYWGSKYGVVDSDETSYQILVEANQQRWWCPKYTSDSKYHAGSGVPSTGKIYECGTWRCDTYVWWAFNTQGYNTMPGYIWLPRTLFNFFPYYNDEKLTSEAFEVPSVLSYKRSLDNVTVEELNTMPFEEFQMIMDAPPQHYVISPSTIQMQLAYSSKLNDIKRGIMIDRLIAEDTEKDLVKKLLNLYRETNRVEVKNKIVQDLMLYNQRHRNIKAYRNNDQPLLKDFFTELLKSKTLNPKMADDAIRGFIDTHSPEEIMASRNIIDQWLSVTNHYASIMLKYTLVHQSKALQPLYIKSLIKELREANNSDLDSYLFGPLSIGYQATGAKLLEPESRQVVVNYLKEIRHKYTSSGIHAAPTDPHRSTTAPYYFELVKNMRI